MFQKLSLIQKAMVLIYKQGKTLPFLEKHVQSVSSKRAKSEAQRAYADAYKSLIGNEEQRRIHWIKKISKV